MGNVIIKIYDKALSTAVSESENKRSEHINNNVSVSDTQFSAKALVMINENDLDANMFSGKDFVTVYDVEKIFHSHQTY